MNQEGWVGVDLDSTLATVDDSKEYDFNHIGEPIKPMVDLVKMYLDNNIKVKIFTARVSDKKNIVSIKKSIEDWCLEHLGQVLPITNIKDKYLIKLFDDRAVHIEPNTGKITKGDTKVEDK